MLTSIMGSPQREIECPKCGVITKHIMVSNVDMHETNSRFQEIIQGLGDNMFAAAVIGTPFMCTKCKFKHWFGGVFSRFLSRRVEEKSLIEFVEEIGLDTVIDYFKEETPEIAIKLGASKGVIRIAKSKVRCEDGKKHVRHLVALMFTNEKNRIVQSKTGIPVGRIYIAETITDELEDFMDGHEMKVLV